MMTIEKVQSLLVPNAGILNCLDLKQKNRQPACMSLYGFPHPTFLSSTTNSQLSHSTIEGDDLNFKATRPSLGFSLLGKSSAFSRWHVDGDGVATAVQIACGSKLWFFCVESDVKPLCSLKNMKGWNKGSCKWAVAFLKEGDQL